jgi:hypothetical protein
MRKLKDMNTAMDTHTHTHCDSTRAYHMTCYIKLMKDESGIALKQSHYVENIRSHFGNNLL